MPSEAQIKFVQDKLIQNKTFFREKSVKCRRAWIVIRTVAIMISGGVTIILGLKATPWLAINPDLTANLALILSAIATFLAAAEATFDFRWKWINYKLTLTRIYRIEDELNYRQVSGDLTQDDLDAAFADLSQTLEGVNTSWKQRRLRGADGGKPDAS